MNGRTTIACTLVVLISCTTGLAGADPRTDYLLYCRGCHLIDGSGVPPEVPTLVNEIGRLVAIPGGREYIIRVPGVSQTAMNNDELAAVMNWVLSELNADTTPENFAPYSSEEVGEMRQKVLVDPLKYRASLLAKQTGAESASNP